MSAQATNYYLIDKLTEASKNNGVSVKYVKHGEYLLNRNEAAKIVSEMLHLINMPCELGDVEKNSFYSPYIGSVLHYGVMEAPDGIFGGEGLMTENDADILTKRAEEYQRRLRASYKPFIASAIQFNPKMYDKERNISNLYNEFKKALKKGARLVVAPEAVTSAYYYRDREDIASYTEPVPGPSTELFAGLAKEFDAYLSYGIAEYDPDTGDYYNSAVLVGPEGYIGKYRKMHQWEVEKHFAADGDIGVPVFSTKIGYLSMIICIDAYYYATARLAAVNGADVLIYNTCDKGESVWAIAARSIQNGMYVISANRSGEECDNNIIGGSAIYDPYAHKLAEAEITLPGNKQSIECDQIFAMIEPTFYQNDAKKLLFDRKPEMYRDIRLNIAPWNSRKSVESRNIEALSVQFEPRLGDIRFNKMKIRTFVDKACQDNRMINLIVMPEMSLIGPMDDCRDIVRNAEPLGESTTEFFASIARRYNCNVVFTMSERDGKNYYHTAVVLETDGTIAGIHRKINLNQQEKKWAVSGNKIDTIVTKKCGRIGVIIGDEYLFPEISDAVLVKRPDIVVMPCAYVNGGGHIEADSRLVVRKYPDNAVLLFDQTAQYMQTGLVIANYVGTNIGFVGGSGMYVPDPVYGRDRIQLAGFKETGFVSRIKTLSNLDYWMNQDIRILTRKPWYYAPLTI